MASHGLVTEQTHSSDDKRTRWQAMRLRTYQVLERDCAHDPASIAVDCLLVALICISVIGIVLESIDALYARHAVVFDTVEVLIVSVFTVEYLLRIWTAVERPCVAATPSSATTKRLTYICTPSALIDLIAIAPFYLTAFGLISSQDLRFLRALRLLRILKLTRYSAAFDTLSVVLRENVRPFTAALLILIVVMLIAATGMYYFEREAQPEAFSSIPASMWWAFATLTTVGYGDVTPVTAAGKVFGALISVVGIGMVALPTGILASAFTEQLRRRTERYQIESDNAWRDGMITPEEQQSLESLRERLGLSEHTASQILDSERIKALLRESPSAAHCPTCGGQWSAD